MINISKNWNDKQKKLKLLLTNEKTFIRGRDLLLEMHSLLHEKKVYKTNVETFYDNLWEDFNEEACKIILNKGTSILRYKNVSQRPL
ncbi:MAG: hypothetical protein LBI14_01930 [Treponema sp.]|nr:hypothetical protein [Treponema sp.]